MSPLDCLVACAKGRTLASFVYLKHATRDNNPIRLAEPYGFVEGRQDVMVRAYQIVPEEGWRFFMAHKLTEAEDTREPFHPRRRITLPTGVVDDVYRSGPVEEWDEARRGYRDLVSDTMADGTVTPLELEEIRVYRVRHRMQNPDVRFVHANLYHRVLGAVVDDGRVDTEELA